MKFTPGFFQTITLIVYVSVVVMANTTPPIYFLSPAFFMELCFLQGNDMHPSLYFYLHPTIHFLSPVFILYIT